MDDNKVAVLLEDLRAQFPTFGEELQLMNEKVDNGFNALNGRVDKLETRMGKFEGKFSQVQESNSQEHQQLMQMVKELDHEVQVELKRVK
jgi:hypothetical protein